MRILLLGGGLQGLSCGASLYKQHEVSIVSNDLMCRKSCFFKKVYSDVKADESLYSLLEKEHFDVLIPISDFTVPFISNNKEEIERRYGVKCGVADYEQVYQVEDKSRFMAFCEANGVPHPKTKPLTDEMLEETAAYVGFPALIKPDFSVGARGITRVNSFEELKERYPQVHSQYGECTLQELIENEEYYYNVMLYRDREGDYPAYAISKIVRMYPIHAGSSSCLITVENDELLQICKDCLDKLNWGGMADFDVLQRLDNGEYKIIEINPRVPASLRAAAISGVNFPEVIAFDARKEPVPTQKYSSGKTLRYLGIDLMWLLKSRKRFDVKPGWFRLVGKNIYYQDIISNDPSTW
jgi:predicted ATP-grasp superfamily ATP-dependent carboligase